MPARCDQEEAPLETGAGSEAKGGTCCKFDQLCSVYLSRLVRACVKLLYLIPWSVSNMAEDDPGQTILPVTRNDLEIALGAANAKNKRTNELLEEHDRQNRTIMSELGSLKQALQKNHPGLSEEPKRLVLPQESSVLVLSGISMCRITVRRLDSAVYASTSKPAVSRFFTIRGQVYPEKSCSSLAKNPPCHRSIGIINNEDSKHPTVLWRQI